jgi:hypothetical protein
VIALIAVSMVYVSLNITPILSNIPGYSTGYTPEIANGVTCSQASETFLNQNNLTYNSATTINTLCTVSYIAQLPSNQVTWTSPLAATQQILKYYSSLDGYLVFIFYLVEISIIGAVALLPNVNPGSLAIGFLLFVVVIIVSFIFSNALNSFFSANILSGAISQLPATRSYFANLGEVNVLFGFIYLIVISARSIGGGGGSAIGGGRPILM